MANLAAKELERKRKAAIDVCEKLYRIGKKLYVSDYFGPDLDTVFTNAEAVAEILSFDFGAPKQLKQKREMATTTEEENDLITFHLWFYFGEIFLEATRVIADTSGRDEIPAKFGDTSRNIAQPYPFLRYVYMCFSGGKGHNYFNTSVFDQENWRASSNGKDPKHGELCKQLGEMAYTEAKKARTI